MAFANETTRSAGNLNEDASAFFYTLMQRVANYRAYRGTINALSDLSNADLRDLGIHRSEIVRVAHETVYGR